MGRFWQVGRWMSLAVVPCLIVGGVLALRRRPEAPLHVTGHVLDARGRPVAGAQVFIQTFHVSDVWTHLQTTTSAPDGTFRFVADREDEPVEICAHRAGEAGIWSISTRSILNFGSLATAAVVVRIRPTSPLRIRALDARGKPIAGIRVGPSALLDQRLGDYRPLPAQFRQMSALTDSRGLATIDSIPRDCSAWIETDDPRLAVPSTIVERPFPTEVRVMFLPACRAEGRVTLEGQPVAGLRLNWRVRGTSQSVLTDSAGRFEIPRAPQGKLTFEDATTGNRQNDAILPDTQVDTDPSRVAHVDIQLQKGALVKFQVVDAQGRPVARAHISGRLLNPPFHPGAAPTFRALGLWQDIAADSDGRAQIRLKPDQYTVQFGLPEERNVAISSLDVGEGSEQQVRLTLPPDWSKDALRVQVIDAEGFPCRADVWCTSQNPQSTQRFIHPIFANPSGLVILNAGQPGGKVFSLQAQFEDEFSDDIVPPVRGSIVVHLHHAVLGAVRGIVRNGRGKPLAGAVVFVPERQEPLAPRATDLYGFQAITGPDGRFVLQGFQSGIQDRVAVQAAGYQQGISALFHVVGGKTVELPPIVMNR